MHEKVDMLPSFLCRLCLDEAEHLLEVTAEVNDKLKIEDVICQHFPPDIGENEISDKICIICWNKLADFHDFFEYVIRAQTNIATISDKLILDGKQSLAEIFIGDEEIIKVDDQIQLDDAFKMQDCQFKDCLDKSEKLEVIDIGMLERGENIISVEFIEDGIQEVVHNTDDNDEALLEISKEQSENVKDSFLEDQIENIISNNLSVEMDDIGSEMFEENSSNNFKNENCLATVIRSERSSREKENGSCLTTEGCENQSTDSENILRSERKRVTRCRGLKKNEISQILFDKMDEDKMIESYYSMECEICHELTENVETLFEHYTKSHSIRGFITCCGKKFFRRAVIAEHVLWHKKPDLFKCNICDEIYSDKKCLNNHMLTHAPPDMKLFKCNYCSKNFSKKFKLEQHKLSHLAPEEKKYLCSECEKPYASGALLRAHKRVVHEKTYAHMCEICARVFKSRVFFEKHQLEHLGQNLPRIQCQICKTWMKNEHTMRAHMRLHQDAGIKHECDVCGKLGPSRNAILKHKRFVHLSERKFKCTLCNKAFKRAITLKEHMAVHTGEVLYRCTFCPKTFNSGANMHAHRKKAHPIEWKEEKQNKMELQNLITN